MATVERRTGIEYFSLQQVQAFYPPHAKGEPFKHAGSCSVLGTTVHLYVRIVPRQYRGRVPFRGHGSEPDDSDDDDEIQGSDIAAAAAGNEDAPIGPAADSNRQRHDSGQQRDRNGLMNGGPSVAEAAAATHAQPQHDADLCKDQPEPKGY